MKKNTALISYFEITGSLIFLAFVAGDATNLAEFLVSRD